MFYIEYIQIIQCILKAKTLPASGLKIMLQQLQYLKQLSVDVAYIMERTINLDSNKNFSRHNKLGN